MKKITTILAVLIAMTAGTTALAVDTAVYDGSNNSVTVGDDISDFSSVLITKGTGGYSGNSSDIVYVDQSDSQFYASMNFMLNSGAADGMYTVLLGNMSGDNKSMTFTIDSSVPDGRTQTPMVKLAEESNGDETYNLAFTLTDDMTDYTVITIKIGDKMGGFYVSDVFGSITGDANLGLQINNVPAGYKDQVEVYMGTGVLTNTYMTNWDAE